MFSMTDSGNGNEDVEYLRDEITRLARALARATQENEDLMKSAEIWIRLYESHLPVRGTAGATAGARP